MLAFRAYEKNLFGQTRSWSARSSNGVYVIEKASSGAQFQARFHPTSGVVVILENGQCLPTYECSRQTCQADADQRLRTKLAQHPRQTR